MQSQTTKEVRVVLLLDEADALNNYGSSVPQQFRGILMMRQFRAAPNRGCTGVHVFRNSSNLKSPFRNVFIAHRLGSISEEDPRRLIVDPVRGIMSSNLRHRPNPELQRV